MDSGTRLGPYEILNPIDHGGMGEVYRARDTRLDRSVALKIIRGGFAGDPKRRARFEREAKVISSLTHPNICHLYDVGVQDGVAYLVMEHIEGETLASKLADGPLPLAQALRVGAEIASALAAAHRQDVVHRDVKPSNIILSRSGAKLVDFGLAKDVPRSSSAKTATLTEEGIVPGTLAYMAPEQISGEAGDSRSDLWAFGAVLYEMVTARPAFEASTRADLMAAILTRNPDLEAIGNPALKQLIAGCLAKDPDERWQSAQDIARQLRSIPEGTVVSRRATGRRSGLLAAALILGIIALSGAIAAWRAPSHRNGPSLSIALPPGSEMTEIVPGMAISADGKRAAFIIRRNDIGELYSRSLDGFDLTSLASNCGVGLAFSPDGEWIAFTRGAKLFKVRATGGPEQFIAEFPSLAPRGIAWGPDGSIYFATIGLGILRARAGGSKPEPITYPNKAADENNHRWPYMLPDGKHLLFTIRTGGMNSFDEARIGMLSLETGRWKVVYQGGTQPSYLPTGHLLFAQHGVLMAVPMDLETGTVRGEAVPVLDGVVTSSDSGASQYAVAGNGETLLYVTGEPAEKQSVFRIVNRKGVVIQTQTLARAVDSFRASPDGRYVAVQISAANDDIWIWDRVRDTLTRLSSLSGDEYRPVWSVDGKSVYFSSASGLFRQPLDHSRDAEQIAAGTTFGFSSPSRDGRVAYVKMDPTTRTDIWIVQADGERKATAFAASAHEEWQPEFSPDGKWISYLSDESGTAEAYLRPSSGPGRFQLTSDGAKETRWSRDGRELYYRNGDDFSVISIGGGNPPTIGRPELMFRLSDVWYFDVLDDGFLVVNRPMPTLSTLGINVIRDWSERVREKLARSR